MSLCTMFPVSPLFTQTPREVYQNANILATVWQHDRRVGFRQPRVWERSKYRCHEHARRGFTEHQCAVLILSHLAVILPSSHCLTSRGHPPPHPSSSVRPSGLANDVAHQNIKKGHLSSPHCVLIHHFLIIHLEEWQWHVRLAVHHSHCGTSSLIHVIWQYCACCNHTRCVNTH